MHAGYWTRKTSERLAEIRKKLIGSIRLQAGSYFLVEERLSSKMS
jgi:hypothetical protein